MVGDGPWTSPSELAEYVFCPRAFHYRRTRDDPGSEAAARGTSYHRRRLGSERRREEHPGMAWLAVAVGLATVALAVGVVVL